MERGLLICFLSFFCCMCHAQAGHVLTADSKGRQELNMANIFIRGLPTLSCSLVP